MRPRSITNLGEVARIRWVRDTQRDGRRDAGAVGSATLGLTAGLPAESSTRRPATRLVFSWRAPVSSSASGEIDARSVLARLERFRARMASEGKQPYITQERALGALLRGAHVLLKTPRATGKTRVAEEWLKDWLEGPDRRPGHAAYFTAPTKALVNEKFLLFRARYGARNVGLVTGDARINRKAPIICCTAELLPPALLHRDHPPQIDRVVMDEAHYLGDRDRGAAWMTPLLLMPHTQFLLMSATLGDSRYVASLLEQRTGRPVQVVESNERPFPLWARYWDTSTNAAVHEIVTSGLGPALVYSGIRMQANRDALSSARSGVGLRDAAHARELQERLARQHFTTSFDRLLQECLLAGVGIHHGGMAPGMRLLVESLFRKELLSALFVTDTVLVGLDFRAVRTLLLTRLDKNDGERGRRTLTASELAQMVGRAGRTHHGGYVVALAPRGVPEHPPRWSESTFRALLARPPEDLEANVTIGHDLLLGLVRRSPATALRDAVRLVRNADLPDSRARTELQNVGERFRALVRAGLVEIDPSRPPAERISCGALPGDLSLPTPRSLFLYEYARRLDPESPSHAYQVLAAAEAIEECAIDPGMLRAAIRSLELPPELIAHANGVSEAFEALRGRAVAEGSPPIPRFVALQILHERLPLSRYLQITKLSAYEGEAISYLQRVRRHLMQSLPMEARTPRLEEMAHRLLALTTAADNSLQRTWRVADGSGSEALELARPTPFAEARPRLEAELAVIHQLLNSNDLDRAVHFLRKGTETWSPEELSQELLALPAPPGPGPALGSTSGLEARPLSDHVWEVRFPLRDEADRPVRVLVGRVELHAEPNAGESLFELGGFEAIGDTAQAAVS